MEKSNNLYMNFSVPKFTLRAIIFFLLLVWCLGIISSLLISSPTLSAISHPILKRLYGTVCHQIEAKTFSINGHRFFVCARCTGIYFGAFIFSFISLIIFPKMDFGLKLLYISMGPMALDVFFTWIGLYNYIKYLAFGTGIFFGSVVFIYILGAIENNFINKILK